LKATFFAEYLNAAFIFGVVLVFVTSIYFLDPDLGGVEGMYDKLTNAASLRPVAGNSDGAYLTMASTGALVFGIINIVGNFGTIFVDQAYWQKAIAARPRSAVKGFLIGGLAWFAIPFALATTLGLAAVATNVSLAPDQIESGLVALTAASLILGDAGAILLLSVLFTAVTTAGSAELVSVSSLVTYDVYRTYVKPWATGRELMRVSRITIIGFGLGMGILSSFLLQLGASLQYIPRNGYSNWSGCCSNCLDRVMEENQQKRSNIWVDTWSYCGDLFLDYRYMVAVRSAVCYSSSHWQLIQATKLQL
jgi:Na+/proline symporter